MNDPGVRRGDHVPLDQRYHGADPIEWCGAAVYPMYTEALPVGTTAVHLRALSVMAPEDVTGLGLGLSVHDGHVNLNGKALPGVDIWYEALVTGIDITVTADAPDALFTLTPVWVAESGTHQSWTGNYGMVVDLLPDGASTLWCSTGPGTPDFNELVVELTTGPATRLDPVPAAELTAPLSPITAAPQSPDVGTALYDLGTAMHERGEHDSARLLWTQAARAGHPGAAYDLGTLFYQAGDDEAAQQWWQTAAHEDPRAAASLTALLERH
ncbi:type IV pilus biogenesis/stability protein PilW [Nocardia sp. NPDC058666]|uniref:tetratricopeptide repeat protein n=1 Tax=Nocardia sp. NPDC058666 TaxID=3346587 RepID=UPI003665A7B7